MLAKVSAMAISFLLGGAQCTTRCLRSFYDQDVDGI
jgi:hypothetical protein